MAYAKISFSHDGAYSINYALGGGGFDCKGHNGYTFRNEFIECINLIPNAPLVPQFESCWKHARSNHTTQLLVVIASFSPIELDADNPDDVEKCRQFGVKFVKKHYPNRQALVCVQVDGEGHMVHCHILINDCDLYEYKGCDRNQKNLKVIRPWTNEVASEFFELDFGERKRRSSFTEINRRKRGLYVWKDDIRDRITAARDISTSEDDFLNNCKLNGILVTRKTREKTGKDYYRYELIDFSKCPDKKIPTKGSMKPVIRSYNLEGEFDVAEIEKRLKSNTINETPLIDNDTLHDPIDERRRVHRKPIRKSSEGTHSVQTARRVDHSPAEWIDVNALVQQGLDIEAGDNTGSGVLFDEDDLISDGEDTVSEEIDELQDETFDTGSSSSSPTSKDSVNKTNNND